MQVILSDINYSQLIIADGVHLICLARLERREKPVIYNSCTFQPALFTWLISVAWLKHYRFRSFFAGELFFLEALTDDDVAGLTHSLQTVVRNHYNDSMVSFLSVWFALCFFEHRVKLTTTNIAYHSSYQHYITILKYQ